MKFKCVNNTDWEHRLTIGKIYVGKHLENLTDELGVKYIVIDTVDDDGLNATFRASRFEEVKEESNG